MRRCDSLHLGLGLFIFLVQSFAHADSQRREREINAHLARFAANPKAVMNEPLPRWDETGRAVAPELRFSPDAVADGSAVLARDRSRAAICQKSGERSLCLPSGMGLFAEPALNDRAETLVDVGPEQMIRTLEGLEARKLREARLPVRPWSSDYFAHYKGLAAERYADPHFPGGRSSWKTNYNYVKLNPAASILSSGAEEDIDVLSPTEKYEILVGNGDFTLTQAMWAIGQWYYDSRGFVEPWMGLCTGWSAASVMWPRPAQSVDVKSADGRRTLRFYPSDLKALANLLWADGMYDIHFVGKRCLERNPRQDANGRIIDSDCLDSNPATWHLAVTHQIGLSGRGLIFDAVYDYEIWNQPVISYSYQYFNPLADQYVSTLADAKVPLAVFPTDRFRDYRSPQAKFVVGIVMDVTYAFENVASHIAWDGPGLDHSRTVRYTYDLELDELGKIVGGEWYTNLHPDFLWVPVVGTQAYSPTEAEAIGEWNPGEPMPESWKNAAKGAAAKGLPLAKVVKALFDRAGSSPAPGR